MKLRILAIRFCAGVAMVNLASTADPMFANFITARDGKLFDGESEFRFISMNIPNLLLVEDNVPFAVENPWRWPNQFEITDALTTVAALGGTVTRTYVISVQRTNDLPDTPRHVLAPGKFNEEAFRTLDTVLATANRTGVRIILPFVDNWPWMGGRAEYAGFRGKSKDDFWTYPQLIADFKQTIHFILTRTNTITGVRYCDDKSILCWETGNEVDAPASWTRDIAHYFKTLDTNHLVMDGGNAFALHRESLENPDVDIVTTHHYPGAKKYFAELIRANAEMAKGKKPYIVGEFGFVKTDKMEEAMQAIRDTGCSGGLLWSLRFRNRDGGFYWHSESDGYKAFHWPASTIGAAYDEINLMSLVRSNAFAIRGLPVPLAAIPASPKLLPIADAVAISWQGSVGATGYQVERAAKRDGNWQIIAPNVDEAFTQYRPQFTDEKVTAGNWFYRIRAKNLAGLSEPSNIVGPVKVNSVVLVDELADFSKVSVHRGAITIQGRDARNAREDALRAAGLAGDELVYKLPAAIQSFEVSAFFPKALADFKFCLSADGKTFRTVAAERKDFPVAKGDYDYWRRAVYSLKSASADNHFLKIEFTGEAQIARVEIRHLAGTR